MLLRLVFLASLGLMLLSAAGYGEENDPVVGRLGGYVIKQSDLERIISFQNPSDQKALRENPEQRITLLRKILEARAVSELARKEKFDERSEVKEQLGFIVNEFLSHEYLKKVVMQDASISEETLREFYEQNEEDLVSPEQVRVRQILIRVSPGFSKEEKHKASEKAQELIKRLKKGEDFVRIAEIYSEDPNPGARTNGGDLGYFTKGQMLLPIEEVAFSLKPGEISNVIETEYGLHIIKVEEHKEARARTFDEVRELIRAKLQEEYASLKAEEFINDTSKEARMEIYLKDASLPDEKEAESGSQAN